MQRHEFFLRLHRKLLRYKDNILTIRELYRFPDHIII